MLCLLLVVQFQAELRSILISLIDVAQTLVCLNSNDLDEAKSKHFQTLDIIVIVINYY